LQEQIASIGTRLKALQADVNRQSQAIDSLSLNCHRPANTAGKENRGHPCSSRSPGQLDAVSSKESIVLQCSRLQEALQKLDKLKAERVRVLEGISSMPAQRGV
jgi:hypothetical protein